MNFDEGHDVKRKRKSKTEEGDKVEKEHRCLHQSAVEIMRPEMNLMGAKRGHFKREETQQEMKSRDETR